MSSRLDAYVFDCEVGNNAIWQGAKLELTALRAKLSEREAEVARLRLALDSIRDFARTATKEWVINTAQDALKETGGGK